MHKQLQDNLPFIHLVTLSDGLNLKRWRQHLNDANTIVRLGRMVLNPLSGVLNELRTYTQGKTVKLTLPYLKTWLLDVYIQKVAYYAIMLYSGRMAVVENDVEILSSASAQSQKLAIRQQAELEKEPLRILVTGQTNAGKSTLINTLFDHPRAATDVVSCTENITPYLLEREGISVGLIFDTPGYGEQTTWLENNRQELDKADLVLLVCSANNAARAADQRFLQAFQQHFVSQVQRKLPPVLVVVTHIDQLRPMREWLPPYNIEEPDCVKSINIRAALDAIGHDLVLPDNTAIVPVSLAANEGLSAYNIDSLMIAMEQQMDEAKRSRLLRCLQNAKDKQKWMQLSLQLANSGRWLLRKVGKAVS